MINNFENFEKSLNIKFKNSSLLLEALTHKSANNKFNNEKLEFLGDRVLGLVVAYLIFNKFKNYDEGNLSKKLSFLVQREFLYNIACKINLKNFLKFNYQKQSSAILNKSILADSIESLIGAIYLDGGYEKSFLFIKRFWSSHLDTIINEEVDPKSKLQEFNQKKYKKLPEYKLIKKEGTPHSPQFTISLNAMDFKNIKAKGSSIREAEKKAAKKILKLLNEK